VDLGADAEDMQCAAARLHGEWDELSEEEVVAHLTGDVGSDLHGAVSEAQQALVGLAPLVQLWAGSILQHADNALSTARKASYEVSSYSASLAHSGAGDDGEGRRKAPNPEEATMALQLMFDAPILQAYMHTGGQRIVGDGGDWLAAPLPLQSEDAVVDAVEEGLAGFPMHSVSNIMLVTDFFCGELLALKRAAHAVVAACGEQLQALTYRKLAKAVLAVRSSGPLATIAGCLALPDANPWNTALRQCMGWGTKATLLGSSHVAELPLGPLFRGLSLVCTSATPYLAVHGVQVCAMAYSLRMQADGPVAAFWIGKPGTGKTTAARAVFPKLFCPWGDVACLLTPVPAAQESAKVQVFGQSTLQLSCSDTVTALPGRTALDVDVHLASTAVQCALSPWTCGPVMGFPERALPLSVFVFDEGGRILTANALAKRREARSAVRTQGKLQNGPLFDYLSTQRAWDEKSTYSLRAGRTDRAFVVFTGNTDTRGEVEAAIRAVQPHAATQAMMSVVNQSLGGGAEAHIIDRCVHGLRTQLVELDAALILRTKAVPKLIHHIQQAAASWGRAREFEFTLGFNAKVHNAASAVGVLADDSTVEAVRNRTVVIDVATVVANMNVPSCATARSLTSEMPAVLGFPTQAVLDNKLLQWAVMDTSRSLPFGAGLKGIYAVLNPDTRNIQFVFSEEVALLREVADGALLLTCLDVERNVSDVVPSPAKPHMVVVERIIVSASGAVRREQEEVEGLRLGGRELGSPQRPSAAVLHKLPFSNATASKYRALIQRKKTDGLQCCGLEFHVSKADPAQLLVLQCSNEATHHDGSRTHTMYGDAAGCGINLCPENHKCCVSGGKSARTKLHPMEVALTQLGVREGVLSRLASLVIQAAHSSQLLLPGSPVHAPFIVGCANGADGHQHKALAQSMGMAADFWEPARFNKAIADGASTEKAALLDLLMLVTPIGIAAGEVLADKWTQRKPTKRQKAWQAALRRSVNDGRDKTLEERFTVLVEDEEGRSQISPALAAPLRNEGLLLCMTGHTGVVGRLQLSRPLLDHLETEQLNAECVCLQGPLLGSEPMEQRMVRLGNARAPATVSAAKICSYGSFLSAPYSEPWRMDHFLYTRGRNRVVFWMCMRLSRALGAASWNFCESVLDVPHLQLYQAMAAAGAGPKSEWATFFSNLLAAADSNGTLTSVALASSATDNAHLSYLPQLSAPPPLHGLAPVELVFEESEAVGILTAASKAHEALPVWQVHTRQRLV